MLKIYWLALPLLLLCACARAGAPSAQSMQTSSPGASETGVLPSAGGTSAPSAAATLTPSITPHPTTALAPVPPEFASLYAELDTALTTFDLSFDASDSPTPVTFAAELLPANGNRGTDLFNPTNLPSTRLWLDRLHALGITGVTVAIKYPLLTADFPNAARYLDYFKTVASEIHQRGMKMDVEVGAIFPPPFSTLDVSYAGLTLDQYKTRNRQMVATILDEIKPDYLDLGAEPDTEAAITGIRALNTPAGYTDVINYTLKDLDRGSTKIGAGQGTWSSVDFVKSEAANTSVDFIALHVYPVAGKALQTAAAAADLAHQYGKRVILDEAWLYKTSANEPPTSIAANSEIFRRDAYSFWSPLDEKFLGVIAKLARAKNIEYVSAFWAQYFFAYLDYDPKLEALSYNQVTAQLNTAATANVLTGNLSPMGEFYQGLIAR